MARVDLNTALAYATAMLNASNGWAVPADGEAHSVEEIREALFQGDEMVILAGLSTTGHFMRPDFMEQAVVLHGARIPEHVGDLGDVLIKRSPADAEYTVGMPATADQIRRYRANAGGVYGSLAHDAAGSPLAGYFNISEEAYLYYTGYQARVGLARYERTEDLQSPGIYLPGVVACGLGTLPMKDGDDPGMAGYFMGIGQGYLSQIRGEAKILPDLAAFKKAA